MLISLLIKLTGAFSSTKAAAASHTRKFAITFILWHYVKCVFYSVIENTYFVRNYEFGNRIYLNNIQRGNSLSELDKHISS